MHPNLNVMAFIALGALLGFLNCADNKAETSEANSFDVSLIKGAYAQTYDSASIETYIEKNSGGSGVERLRLQGVRGMLNMSDLKYDFRTDSTVHIKGVFFMKEKDTVTAWRSDGKSISMSQAGKEDLVLKIHKLESNAMVVEYPNGILSHFSRIPE